MRSLLSRLTPAVRQWLLAFIFLFHWVVPLYRACTVDFTVWRAVMVAIGFALMVRAIQRARQLQAVVEPKTLPGAQPDKAGF